MRRSGCFMCGGQDLLPASRWEPLFRCRCGLIHHLRSQSIQEEEARYQDVVFDSPLQVAQQQLDWLERALLEQGLPRSGRLLDLGCGSGSFLCQAQAAGWQVCGTEISQAAAERARQRLGGQVLVHSESLESFPQEPGFDVVTLWDVLDHLEEPHLALDWIHRRLRPGGLVMVRTRNGPVHLALRNWEKWLRHLLGRPPARDCIGVIHRYGFSSALLRRCVADSQFTSLRSWKAEGTQGQRDRSTGLGRPFLLLKSATLRLLPEELRPSLLLSARRSTDC